MSHRPRTLSCIQSQIQCIVADNSNRRHTDPDGSATIVGVGKAEVGFGLVANNFCFRQFRQQPDLPASIQATSRLIMDFAANQGIRKLKGIGVLDDLVAVSDNAQHRPVRIPDICLIVPNLRSTAYLNIPLFHRPVQSGQPKCVGAGGSLLYLSSQTVPRLFTDVHHTLYQCWQDTNLLKFILHSSKFARLPILLL